MSEIVVNEYLPSLEKEETLSLDLPDSLDVSKGIQTNILGADFDMSYSPSISEDDYSDTEVYNEYIATELNTNNSINGNSTGLKDFEDENFIPITANVYIRDEQIKSAGFATGYLEKETHNDYLFKNIYIADIFDTDVTKYMVRDTSNILAKVYVYKIGYKSDVDQTYNFVKERISKAVNMTVNETNQFGYASFYMNDPKRPDTSFLTTRIGGLLYSFSYPKEYHSQIKNLIKLIEWDLG